MTSPGRTRIAYLSSSDPLDKRSWSGIHHNIYNCIQKHIGTPVALGPFHPKMVINTGRAFSLLNRKLTGKRFDYTHSLRTAKAYGNYFTEHLQRSDCKSVFAVAASSELAFLNTSLPVYYTADATFANMIGYYPFYSSLSERSICEGHEVQQRALDKCAQLFFPSEWAAESAIKDYGISSSKIHVVPFGANIDEIPSKINARKNNQSVQLLFIGVEWERKGGPIAVEAFNELLKRGIDVQLTIVGCTPAVAHDKITIVPFLNKNIPTDRAQLNSIFAAADFFILPTTAECYGLVFCEASAFGVPSLASDTGGVGGAVRNGVNGFLLPPNASGKDYADKIIGLISDIEKLPALRKTSRELFEKELNWESWGTAVSDIIRK